MKKLFFALTFIFVGVNSFGNTYNVLKYNLIENDLECIVDYANTLEETINLDILSYDLGWCTFSYSITVTNNLTGESTTTNYTQTVPASSQADCNAAAQNWITGHMNAIRATLS